MGMNIYRRILVPFLMGQRRDGLCRIRDIDSHAWEVLDVPGFKEAEISDSNEKIRRMGEIYALFSELVKEAATQDSVPVSIAGDCVSALGMLAGLQKAGKQPDRILWLDAHGDFHTWQTTQTKYIGGMPLAMLVGRGDRREEGRNGVFSFEKAIGFRPYPENQIILSDARDVDPGEKEAIQNSKIIKCSIADVFKHLAPNENLYLHWDTDVVDAETGMPALKYHAKAGPTYSEICSLFKSLRNKNIIAVSVSAWHEEKDLDNKTAIACLRLLEELGLDMNFS
jgi:arginase